MRLAYGKRLSFVFLLTIVVVSPMAIMQPSAETTNSTIPDGFTLFDKDTTFESDLVIDDDKSVVIEGCSFSIKGRIVLTDSSTLTIRNSTIRLIESRGEGAEGGEFWFNVSGDSRLQAVNVDIETVYFRSFSIRVSGSAEVLFHDVYSLEWYGLVCEGSSRVNISGSVCWSMIETRDASLLSVEESRIYGVNVTDDSNALLDGVYTTKASVAESGSLEIRNSTISSDSDGLELIFDRGSKLTLRSFPTLSTGIDYEYCEGWTLHGDNEVSNSHLDVSLSRVYLRVVRFVILDGADVEVDRYDNAHTIIVCSDDYLRVVGSTLKEAAIIGDCALNASSLDIAKIHASQGSSARIEASKMGLISCNDEGILVVISSVIDSIEMRDGAILQLGNCSVPESTSVLENSIMIHSGKTISTTDFDYKAAEGALTLRIVSPIEEGSEIEIILNRDRARYRKNLPPEFVLHRASRGHAPDFLHGGAAAGERALLPDAGGAAADLVPHHTRTGHRCSVGMEVDPGDRKTTIRERRVI